jgi:hypothetical protein
MTRCTLARVPFSQGAASFYPQVRAISKPSTERRTSVSGVAIISCAIWIGPRERFPQTTQRPNNLATNRTTHLSLETWRRNSFRCAILSNVSTVPPVPRTNTLPPFSCLQLSQFAGEGAGRASRVFNLLQLTWPAHLRSTQQSPVDPRYNCYSESTLAARARE